MNFNEIKNKSDLLNFLSVKESQFDYYFFVKKNKGYTSIRIPKKDGGRRSIDIPPSFIKDSQYRLLNEIEKVYKPKSCVYGFISYKKH